MIGANVMPILFIRIFNSYLATNNRTNFGSNQLLVTCLSAEPGLTSCSNSICNIVGSIYMSIFNPVSLYKREYILGKLTSDTLDVL